MELRVMSLEEALHSHRADLEKLTGPRWPSADYNGQSDMTIALQGELPWADWSRVLVATDGGQVVAWALASHVKDSDRGLVDVCVAGAARRAGLGSDLWRRAAALLVEYGCAWVSSDRNPWSEALGRAHLQAGAGHALYAQVMLMSNGGYFETLLFGGWA